MKNMFKFLNKKTTLENSSIKSTIKKRLNFDLASLIITMIFIIALIPVNFVSALNSDTSQLSIDLANQDPTPASAGDIVKLRFQIENQGGKSADN